jgi:uncharacterized protein (DUF885 family)
MKPILAVVLALSCASPSSTSSRAPAVKPGAPESPDEAFQKLAARFIAEDLRRNPTDATTIGEHAWDGNWPDLSAAGEAETRAFIARTAAALAAIPAGALSQQNSIDAQMLDSKLRQDLFSLDELRPAENDPLSYTGLVGSGIDPLVTRSFAPHKERMRSLLSRLRGVPQVVAAAKARLGHPPRVHTETAIEQNRGLIHLCDGGLDADLAQEPLLAKDLGAAAKQAAAALSDFQIFLEKDLLPRSTGDFRAGRAVFEKELRFALDDQRLDIDAVAQGARALIDRTHEEMLATATALWPELLPKEKLPAAGTPAEKKALIRKVLDVLAKDRPDNATIVQEAARDLEQATAFVRAHDLVTVPDEPCRVIEMPEYRRGVAVAYCDSSGPLEKKQETFVAISPTPSDWKPARIESFYREYNRSMLDDLIVHEAMPGHFLQLMHANQFKSDVRSLLGSGPFVEGWAVYGEWLMAKKGFGGARVRLLREKMILRTAANAILDHDIHAGAMTEQQALALMMGDAFQEEGEATGKWRRARLSSAQLSTYYYGFSELMKLREQLETAPGFSERGFHDKLLSFGSPSLRHIRALMLPAGR